LLVLTGAHNLEELILENIGPVQANETSLPHWAPLCSKLKRLTLIQNPQQFSSLILYFPNENQRQAVKTNLLTLLYSSRETVRNQGITEIGRHLGPTLEYLSIFNSNFSGLFTLPLLIHQITN